MSAEGKALKEQYILEARSQWGKDPIEGKCTLKVHLHFGDKRKRDIDNYNKLVLDALEGIVYENDKQVEKLIVTKQYNKDNPHICVEIL